MFAEGHFFSRKILLNETILQLNNMREKCNNISVVVELIERSIKDHFNIKLNKHYEISYLNKSYKLGPIDDIGINALQLENKFSSLINELFDNHKGLFALEHGPLVGGILQDNIPSLELTNDYDYVYKLQITGEFLSSLENTINEFNEYINASYIDLIAKNHQGADQLKLLGASADYVWRDNKSTFEHLWDKSDRLTIHVFAATVSSITANTPLSDGQWPLVRAIKEDDIEMLEILLTSGARISPPIEEGGRIHVYTKLPALHAAVVLGNRQAVTTLLERNPYPNDLFVTSSDYIFALDYIVSCFGCASIGATPLHLASTAINESKNKKQYDNFNNIKDALLRHGAKEYHRNGVERDRAPTYYISDAYDLIISVASITMQR